ncbi:MAG: PEGA domain-containing protein, partial [Acidobacteriota bacterium]
HSRRRLRWSNVALVAAVIAAIALVAIVARISGSSAPRHMLPQPWPPPLPVPPPPPPPPPAPPKAAEPAPAPVPTTITLHVISDPPGATVVLDGVRLGTAPFTQELPIADRDAWLKVRLPHHIATKIRVSLARDIEWNVRLQPLP